MQDNIIIEEEKYSEELYEKNIKENEFVEDTAHGIGDEINGNS